MVIFFQMKKFYFSQKLIFLIINYVGLCIRSYPKDFHKGFKDTDQLTVLPGCSCENINLNKYDLTFVCDGNQDSRCDTTYGIMREKTNVTIVCKRSQMSTIKTTDVLIEIILDSLFSEKVNSG